MTRLASEVELSALTCTSRLDWRSLFENIVASQTNLIE